MSDIKVQETVHDQPDVSEISPVPIPPNCTRSPMMKITFINKYGKYEPTYGYWDAIDKVFRGTDGLMIVDDNEKIARTESL